MNWSSIITEFNIYYPFYFFTDSVQNSAINGCETFILKTLENDVDLDELDQNLSWLRSEVPLTQNKTASLPSITGKIFIEPMKGNPYEIQLQSWQRIYKPLYHKHSL